MNFTDKRRAALLLIGFFALGTAAAFAQDASSPAIPDASFVNSLFAPFQQVMNSPGALLIIPVLSIVAWLIEMEPTINSRFIPPILVGMGGGFYWVFTSTASVPKSFPHPAAVLVANGVLCGFLSFVVHKQLICRFFVKPTVPPANP